MIGLEVHCKLKTESKLFCPCSTSGEKPNSSVCPICLGFPGAKPSLNAKAIELAVRTAVALNSTIPSEISFDRKNYYYPDLAKNFQITQLGRPVATRGFLEVNGKKIGITRIQIEEDPASIAHYDIIHEKHCLLDYNRSGAPLCEIVTEPAISSPEEARIFLKELFKLLSFLEVIDPLEKAVMRCDANASVPGGERVELKNITGFEAVEKALAAELSRQKAIVGAGGRVERETRAFADGESSVLRSKEVEEDYGYIGEPDLPAIIISREFVESQRFTLSREETLLLERDYKIPRGFAKVIAEKKLGAFYRKACSDFPEPLLVAKWVSREVLRGKTQIAPLELAGLLRKLSEKKLTEKQVRERLRGEETSSEEPLSDEKEISEIAEKILEEEKKAVADYAKGKPKALDFLVGQLVKKRECDARVARKIIEEKLLE